MPSPWLCSFVHEIYIFLLRIMSNESIKITMCQRAQKVNRVLYPQLTSIHILTLYNIVRECQDLSVQFCS